eukprot:1262865-Rhodomonas_salina.1
MASSPRLSIRQWATVTLRGSLSHQYRLPRNSSCRGLSRSLSVATAWRDSESRSECDWHPGPPGRGALASVHNCTIPPSTRLHFPYPTARSFFVEGDEQTNAFVPMRSI